MGDRCPSSHDVGNSGFLMEDATVVGLDITCKSVEDQAYLWERGLTHGMIVFEFIADGPYEPSCLALCLP